MRIVRLLCLTDGYTYPRTDNGVNKEGEDTQSRASLKRALETRIDCGNDVSMPACVLAEVPPSSGIKDDPIDRLLRDTDGKWNLGTPSWHAEKERRCAEREKRSAAAAASLRTQTSNAVVEGLASLIKTAPPQESIPAVKSTEKGARP